MVVISGGIFEAEMTDPLAENPCMCVCVRERESEKENEKETERECVLPYDRSLLTFD